MRCFFYGSLCDPKILRIVLGRRLPSRSVASGWLGGGSLRRARHGTFPILTPANGGRVAGLIVDHLSVRDRARLCWFEGADYRLARGVAELAATGGTVRVRYFQPQPRVAASPAPWEFAIWRRRASRAFALAAARRMAAMPGANGE